jgi:hypothetical protein
MKNKAASELGKLAKGKPKNYSKKERQKRRDRMIELNKSRRKDEGQKT